MTRSDELRAEAHRLTQRADELDTQLTQADVRQMYAERRYAEIVQAKKDGRLDNYLTTTTQED